MLSSNAKLKRIPDNDIIHSVPISMSRIDCSQDQLKIVESLWPIFKNSKVRNEFILDASEFSASDVYRLSCIFMKNVGDIAGKYILLSTE